MYLEKIGFKVDFYYDIRPMHSIRFKLIFTKINKKAFLIRYRPNEFPISSVCPGFCIFGGAGQNYLFSREIGRRWSKKTVGTDKNRTMPSVFPPGNRAREELRQTLQQRLSEGSLEVLCYSITFFSSSSLEQIWCYL